MRRLNIVHYILLFRLVGANIIEIFAACTQHFDGTGRNHLALLSVRYMTHLVDGLSAATAIVHSSRLVML